MNKKLFIARIALLVISIILFIVCMTLPLNNSESPFVMLFPIVMVILVIINLVDIIKKHDYINHDVKYNIAYLISIFIFLLITLRTLFDIGIVANVYGTITKDAEIYRLLFLESNLIYINILAILLIIYRFTFNGEKK